MSLPPLNFRCPDTMNYVDHDTYYECVICTGCTWPDSVQQPFHREGCPLFEGPLYSVVGEPAKVVAIRGTSYFNASPDQLRRYGFVQSKDGNWYYPLTEDEYRPIRGALFGLGVVAVVGMAIGILIGVIAYFWSHSGGGAIQL